MKTVLLRLEGPMQSWGTSSRFELRDTELEPSKSGVVGLVGAALGVRRGDTERLAELAKLSMCVRVDRAGVQRSDYQTAGGGSWPGRKRYGVYKASGAASSDATLSRRYYLADASFVVGLAGNDVLAQEIDDALRAPKWPLFLGRKGYVPSQPIPMGVVEAPIDEAVQSAPYAARPDTTSRVVVEVPAGEGLPRQDVPIDFTPDARRFGTRYVQMRFIENPPEA